MTSEILLVNRKYNQTSIEKEREIINEYVVLKNTTKNISEKLGISPSTVLRVLKRNNINIDKTRRSKVKRVRRFDVNDNYFTKIDSNEKAYILGLLYADGYLTIEGSGTKTIGIDLIDEEILREISLRLDYKGEVRHIKNYKSNSGFKSVSKRFRLKFSSEKIYENLINLGCTPRKSLTLTFPTEEQVPKKFIKAFILGYFDGDGSIIKTTRKGKQYKNGKYESYSLSFVGTEEFLNSLKKVLNLEHLKNNKRWKERDNNHFEIRICGNNQAYRVLKELYEASPIFLKRKHDKFKDLENIIVVRNSNITS